MTGKAIPLGRFLDEDGRRTNGRDEIPTGPSRDGAPDPAKPSKYVVEWNGNGPLPIPAEVRKAESDKTTFTATNRLHTQPPATADDFKAKVLDLVREYFDSADVMEVVRQLEELRMPRCHDQLVRRAIILSLERTDREREMVAVLVAALHTRRIVSSNQVFQAFIQLLEGAADLAIDCPAAPGMLSHFLADAVLDGCLTPTFIAEPPPLSVNLTPEARKLADGILADAKERLQRGTAVASPSESLAVPVDVVKANIDSLIAEYLQAEDVSEVARRLREGHVHLPLRHEVVKRGVRVAMQRGPAECESMSRLVSTLYGRVLPAPEIARGFEALLEEAPDLALDMPGVPRLLGNFLARAVSDEVLAVSFLDQALRTTPVDENGVAHETLHRAKALLSIGHSGAWMARIWGPAAVAAKAPVADLKAMFDDVVREFFVSRDQAEVGRALAEMDVPFYHHEFAKKLLQRGVEGSDEERARLLELLTSLARADPPGLAPEAISLGFARLHLVKSDLRLDVPNADAILEGLKAACIQTGIITE